MRKHSSLLLAALLTLGAAQPAFADYDHGHGHGPEHHEDWRGHGDIHSFHEHGYDHWRGGNWFEGDHGGRHGWWWVVEGTWYYYPQPVYPFPDPYIPPTVVLQAGSEDPVTVAPNYVYYCSRPAGYYPYVGSCYRPWRRVLTQTVVTAPPAVVEQPAPPPSVTMDAPNLRDADDRKLNALAAEFDAIDKHGPGARTRLKDMEEKVRDFRQSLYSHGDGSLDIIRDADALEHRITEEREDLH